MLSEKYAKQDRPKMQGLVNLPLVIIDEEGNVMKDDNTSELEIELILNEDERSGYSKKEIYPRL